MTAQPIIPAYSTSAAIFEQQNLSLGEQFAIFAKGLVGVVGSWTLLDRPDCHLTVQLRQ